MPFNGRYRAQTMRLGARYGFTDRFEGAIGFDVSHVTYSADALILSDFEESTSSGEATEQIIDFNSNQFGASDMRLAGRYNLYSGPVLVTTSTTAKLPTGYEGPTATFVEENSTETGGQATFGDNQVDLTQRLLLGAFINETNTFIRAEAGARYRFGAPGHQGVADLRIGQFVGDNLIFIGGVSGVTALTEGEVIGQTLVAIDPSVAAAEFTGDNIESQDLRIDRDALNLHGGLLLDLGESELTANYAYTVWGRNTAAVHSFSVGTIMALPDVTGR